MADLRAVRTPGVTAVVSSGDVLFTLIGMAGLYFVLGLLYLYLVGREIAHGPAPRAVTLRRVRGGAMVELWFALLCFMLTMFVVLDGWNIGAGALHLIVGEDRPSGARSSPPSDRCGAGTRSGSSPPAARSSAFPESWPPRSPASTSRSGSCSGRSSCAGSRSRSAAISTTGSGARRGTSCSPLRACCSPSCLALRSAT